MHWVVRREEVELTEEVVGRGGWGEVRVARFRGLRVAAKFLYDVILSDYNRRQFVREMTIAAKLRHPHLLLFIGATREGQAIILTELMPTSLRRELERREMPRVHVTSISQDVGRALCYLHQWQPHPIIHRDISSANVLLEPLPIGGYWHDNLLGLRLVLVSHFMNLVSYAAHSTPVVMSSQLLVLSPQLLLYERLIQTISRLVHCCLITATVAITLTMNIHSIGSTHIHWQVLACVRDPAAHACLLMKLCRPDKVAVLGDQCTACGE